MTSNSPRGHDVLTFDLATHGLARSRFALSRLVELSDGLEVLTHPSRAPYAERWVRRTRRQVDRSAISVVLALVEHDHWYVPDFLVPVPDRYEPTLDEELAALVATPAAVVLAQLATAFRLDVAPVWADARELAGFEGLEGSAGAAGVDWPGWPSGSGGSGGDDRPPLPREVAEVLDDGGVEALTACVADQLLRCWKVLLADSWDGVRRVLDADVRRHATLASRTGLADIVGTVHPALSCDGGCIELEHARTARVGCASGVVLTPSVFLPTPAVWLGRRGQAMIGYPAHGRGQVWSLPSPLVGAAGPLGASRAALLADLGVPRSTADLAARHGLSPATVSYHLRLLHDAGLLSRHRSGRTVMYERTEPAATIVTGSAPDQ